MKNGGKNHLIRYLSWMCVVLAAMAFYGTAAADYVSIRGTVVNVRQGPGTSHQTLFQAKQGEEYDLIATEGLWCRIRLESGQEAWVYRKLVDVLEGDRAGATPSELESEVPDDASSGLSVTARIGLLISALLFLAVVFLKRRAILRFSGSRLREISGYKRDQAFRYDNRKPSDDSWEL